MHILGEEHALAFRFDEVGQRSGRVSRNVYDLNLALREPDAIAIGQPDIDRTAGQMVAVPGCRAELVVARLQGGGVERVDCHPPAESLAERRCATGVIVVAMRQQQVLNLLRKDPGRFDVQQHAIAGTPAAGIDQSR